MTEVNGDVLFRVWAPFARTVELCLESVGASFHPMGADDQGYYSVLLSDVPSGAPYRFRLDGTILRPDPASRWQPDGVHTSSRVWDWRKSGDVGYPSNPSDWSGHALRDLIFYELHVGTFSPEGTFDGVTARLDHLVDLGVTAVELMPVGQCPGDRNWGYDGVYAFAVQNSYGGPEGLLRLVRACHTRGLSVFLDVVYNHLGPEGNYLSSFGPYFSHTTRTPWGDALNFDEADSDHVRHYFLENIRYWATVFDMDGFRFDAVHAIRDQSPHPFLTDVASVAGEISLQRGRPVHLVAESNLNDRRTVISPEKNGIGFDAQWSDDFHHALHVTLTGERNGYYADFSGSQDLLDSLGKGFVYQGAYSPSFRHRRGSRSDDLPGSSFVVFAQNHDQVGNRMLGDRLSSSLSAVQLRLSAALVVLAPALPLLFMGEEYGEKNPFLYFTSHGDSDLIRAVREGREKEFRGFGWTEEVPDPQDPETFSRSRLSGLPGEGQDPEGRRKLFAFYRLLIELRKNRPALSPPDRMDSPENRVISPCEDVLVCHRGAGRGRISWLANLSCRPKTIRDSIAFEGRVGRFLKEIDSCDLHWGGDGSSLPKEWTVRKEKDVPLDLKPFQFALFQESSE
ncbi:MAG: malto-oligosyltrehalose trehalohydrolase [Leptospirales bacterium]